MRKNFLILMLLSLLPLAGWAADGDILTEPTAKTSLTYSGSAQELVTAGTVDGSNYSMFYAVVASTEEAPAWSIGEGGKFSKTLPKATDAGTYHVYFVAYEDGGANPVTPTVEKRVTVTIDKKELTVSTDYTTPTKISSLTYSGAAQQLINAGSVTNAGNSGNFTYTLDDTDYTDAARVKGTDAKTYTIKWSLPGSKNYKPAQGTISDAAIDKKSIEDMAFSFVPGAATRTYGDEWNAPTFTVAKFGNVDVTYDIKWYTNADCTEGETAAPAKANTVGYYAKVTGNGNFEGSLAYAAGTRDWTFTVAKRQLRILVNPQEKAYNGQEQTADADFTIIGWSDEDEAKEYTGITTTKVNDSETVKTVGTYKMKAATLTDAAKIGTDKITDNYTPVYMEQGYLKITPLTLIVAVNGDKHITFGGTLPSDATLSSDATLATVTGVLVDTENSIDETSSVKAALKVGLKAQETADADFYKDRDKYTGCWAVKYDADDATLKNYNVETTDKDFYIDGAGFTIMAIGASKTYDGKDISNAGLSYIAFDDNDDVVELPSSATVTYEVYDAETDTWSATLPSGVGNYKYRVAASKGYASGNYDASLIKYESASVKIKAKKINITVKPITLHVGDDADILNKYATYEVAETTPLVGSEKLNVIFTFENALTSDGDHWDATAKALKAATESPIASAISAHLATASDYEVEEEYDLLNNGNYELEVVTPAALTIAAGTSFIFDVNDRILEKIEDADGTEEAAVKFANTKYNLPAGKWRTLVLPFDITPLEFSNAIGKYALFNTLESANIETNQIVFTLEQENLPANKPFLVKVPEAVNLDEVAFTGRTIAYEKTPTLAISAYKVEFIGSYVDETITGGEKIMWMKSDGSFVKATDSSDAAKDFTNYCFHAYFDLTGAGFASAPLIIVEEADGSTTAISSISADGIAVEAEGWYTLNGVKLQAAPTTKGIYIRNGKKVVVK